ncbi:uncharacterized protein Z520_06782 [Fonsecaea multimorphosa CBS 102226]|uniref:Uncharacterized protein n=1 Tax=Fonsecaea multimorphosa CBS 102226 TaxID=1442371 RepID=A0A0D2H659_9EURO|nr:uncharacterized protein Z520_06782 [Fonsecaea multimorphosa CBS 102226]KIX97330.1 hypothetical protein Z520_06782 [Fonsecaea multimorphosa CBS 102226]OAL23297.1 hypothetical protein AYO22_06347 [Fonsecaea multimorphosa]
MGETHSSFIPSGSGAYGTDSEQDDWPQGNGAGHGVASTPVRRRILANPTSLPPYGISNLIYKAKRRNESTKTWRRTRVGNSTAANKSAARGNGRGSGKSKPLESASSNKYHKAVFPGMRVPVYMRKDGWGARAVTQSRQPEYVPVMSVQCPMPGGTAVTMATDPVQKVRWGPITRIEASKEARELINLWREAVEDSKKAKGKAKSKEGDESEEDASDKPVKTKKAKNVDNGTTVATGFEFDGESGHQNISSIKDDLTPATTSQAETEATTDTNPPRRFLKPPPPTPPDTIFHKTHSVEAALSMPTLPMLHRISDPQLVEQYRLQHAMDPEAFEKETRAIKKGLVGAKVARGGKPRLLKNEYTVELASREDAETAEKWVRDQGRTFGVSDMRSRANSMLAASDAGSASEELRLKMRGGEMGNADLASTVNTKKECKEEDKPQDISEQQFPTLQPAKHAAADAEGVDETLSAEPKDKQNTSSDSTTTAKYTLLRSKPTLRHIRSQLSRLDLSEHVSKITTYGSVRHQHSVKREADDLGERRTVKTWIEITEVYEVPSASALTFQDVVAAVDEEAEERDTEEEGWEGGSDEEWSRDSDESDNDTAKESGKRMKKNKKSIFKSKGKAKASMTLESDEEEYDSDSNSALSSSSTTSESDSASDHAGVHASAKGHHDPEETDAEALFRSLSRFGEVNAERIAQVSSDLRALMAGLRTEGKLETSED